ncbi:MAG: hypothetical protein ACXABY_04425 [Candidatus Thorarchaeota archaeon]|jgi:hypothetical protein
MTARKKKSALAVTVGADSKNLKGGHTLSGKVVSINQKSATYFGVGDGDNRVWLSPENYWCQIPDDLTSQDYEILTRGLAEGKLVWGKVFVPPIDKPSNVPDEYWIAIEAKGFEAPGAKQKFSRLLRSGTDRGYTAIELAEFCYDKERNGRRRPSVLRLLKEVMDNYDGPIRLYTPPDNDDDIESVKISADGSIIAKTKSGAEVAKNIEPEAPEGYAPGKKSNKEALDDFIS